MGRRWILFAGFMARMRLPTSGVGGGGRKKTRVNGVCRCVVNDLQSFLVLVSPTGRISLFDGTMMTFLRCRPWLAVLDYLHIFFFILSTQQRTKKLCFLGPD